MKTKEVLKRYFLFILCFFYRAWNCPCKAYYALLTDNGNHRNYHKMYIAFAGGAEEFVPAVTRWHAETHYLIEKL